MSLMALLRPFWCPTLTHSLSSWMNKKQFTREDFRTSPIPLLPLSRMKMVEFERGDGALLSCCPVVDRLTVIWCSVQSRLDLPLGEALSQLICPRHVLYYTTLHYSLTECAGIIHVHVELMKQCRPWRFPSLPPPPVPCPLSHVCCAVETFPIFPPFVLLASSCCFTLLLSICLITIGIAIILTGEFSG